MRVTPKSSSSSKVAVVVVVVARCIAYCACFQCMQVGMPVCGVTMAAAAAAAATAAATFSF